MALEAVVFPQDLFGYSMRELFSIGGEFWGYDFGDGEQGADKNGAVPFECNAIDCAGSRGSRELEQNATLDASCSTGVQVIEKSSSPEVAATLDTLVFSPTKGRKKRQRSRIEKNQEEMENQRMTHIAVERNRRKQMNEYLAVLRSLMPASYVQRSDQASIIGGAINFVKELEKLVQFLEAHKRIKQRSDSAPFADFFTFPQYSSNPCPKPAVNENIHEHLSENKASAADIEVTMVDTYANLKILSPRQPKQLLKIVIGLQNLHLTTLHLNVTTIDETVFYSFSLKVEDECQLTSVDEIAAAVHQLVGKIQENASF
ncbi:transcription factor bHLH94-like [Zingiber officinale]|nr:transcription factor bHLH94-like [Zingiber officinale]